MIVIPAKAGTQHSRRALVRAGVAKLFLALALLLLAAPALAQDFPKLTGRVVDQASLLSPQQEADLAAKSEALERQTGRQFVVATVSSLGDRTIEDYGYQLGRQWGIGREGQDDGVILLVAPNEKKVRIETGYGAEGFLPDILAGRIIRNDILPRFRSGDMAGGIMAGADAVIRQMSLPDDQAREQAEQATAQERSRQQDGPGILPVIFWFMIIGFVLLSFARRAGGHRYHRRRRGRGRDFDAGDAAIILWGLNELAQASRKGRSSGWGGGFGGWGGGGGGFGGFSGGGGSFGGGGASGSW